MAISMAKRTRLFTELDNPVPVEEVARVLEPFAQAADTLEARTRRTLNLPGDGAFVSGITLGECRAARDLRDRLHAAPAPTDDAGVLQDDLGELLRLLGLPDGARPQSPHEVLQECLAVLRQRLPSIERIAVLEIALHALLSRATPETINAGIAALDRARSAQSALAPPAPEGWRPIESAPKDGTDVLLWGPAYKTARFPRPPVVGACDPISFNDDGWYGYDDEDVRLQIYPTHWMPLPTAPTPAELERRDRAEGGRDVDQ